MEEEQPFTNGDSIVVRTPDHRTFAGTLLEIRESAGIRQAVVRLETGWVTTFPLTMVHPTDG